MKKIRCLLVVLLAMSIQFARGAEKPASSNRISEARMPKTRASSSMFLITFPVFRCNARDQPKSKICYSEIATVVSSAAQRDRASASYIGNL
jgi:flagellar basal body-associated protein FliL